LFDDLPAAFERIHDDGLDQQEDVFGRGVVRADHGALGLVERALEQGAEDDGFDVGPIVLRGSKQDAEVSVVERNCPIVGEEAAVEKGDIVGTEEAVFLAHGLEEMRQHAVKADRRVAIAGDHAAEGVVRKQTDGICEEAKDESHEEMRDLFLLWTFGHGGLLQLQALGEVQEIGGGGFGDSDRGYAWAKLVVVAEDVAQDLKRWKGTGGSVAGDQQIVEIESVDAGGEVFKLGVDLEADEVADDEQRGVVEGLVILVELLVGLLEVATLGLVFPGEEAALPDVGVPLFAAAGFGDTLLVGVVGADLVGLGWVGHVEDFAEVAEVLGCGGALGE